MGFLTSLKSSERNIAALAAYHRGEATILDEHETALNDVLINGWWERFEQRPYGFVTLGRAAISQETSYMGVPIGRTIKDFENPTGVWLEWWFNKMQMNDF
jgi:hypothetical protein